MKRFLTLMLLSMAAITWTACDPNKGNDDGGETPPANEYYEFPLVFQEEGFTAEDNGVNINISDVKENNIIFNLVPGEAVKSYRMTVYPKAMIYNLLLNEGHVEGTQEACEQTLITLLSSSTVFNAESYDDFAAKEFDWVNSLYTSAPIISDCEYFIIVVGCYDTAGQNPASISIAHLTTPSKDLVGNPEIGIEAEVGYTGFIVRYHPNEDCKYFYHWIWSTEEIGEYIDLFGEKMMRDFCRSAVTEAYDATMEENLAIKRTVELSTATRENTAIAVACDANGTPSDVIMRNDFVLKDVPEGNYDPVANIKIGDRVSATSANVVIEMEENCYVAVYRLYTAEEAENLMNASDEVKQAEAQSIASQAWHTYNTNFSFNSDLGTLTGSGITVTEEMEWPLEPETEYVLGYVAQNYFQQVSELKFTQPFRTKPLVRDNPDACEADIELYFTNISRWGFTYNFDYDYSKMASFRFQLVYPYDETAAIIPPHYINDAGDREKWLKFFYDTYETSPAGFERLVANWWVPEKAGHEEETRYGYESGITFVFAYCAEDLNGVVGPVKFVQVTTTEANPGPNPQISIENISYDDENGIVTGRFKTNEDSKMIKYFGVGVEDALYSTCALHDLVNGQRRDYDAYMSLWKTQLIELGLSSNAESIAFGVSCEKNADTPVLVAAVAIGEDEEGLDCYSDIACKIYYKGEFKDLSDFRTPPSK